jgi:hypothetical protein
LELLELEMRARAIKSLLSVEKTDADEPVEPEKPADPAGAKKPVAESVEKPKEKVAPEAGGQKKAEEVTKKATEEEKKLQKAREALYISEAKKKEQEEAEERQRAEIRSAEKKVFVLFRFPLSIVARMSNTGSRYLQRNTKGRWIETREGVCFAVEESLKIVHKWMAKIFHNLMLPLVCMYLVLHAI